MLAKAISAKHQRWENNDVKLYADDVSRKVITASQAAPVTIGIDDSHNDAKGWWRCWICAGRYR